MAPSRLPDKPEASRNTGFLGASAGLISQGQNTWTAMSQPRQSGKTRQWAGPPEFHLTQDYSGSITDEQLVTMEPVLATEWKIFFDAITANGGTVETNSQTHDVRWIYSAPRQGQRAETMFDKLVKLYYAYMTNDVRSPIPHLAGPPGTNKSTSVQQLADLLGVTLHTVNVSRISPLEIEGVQMPVTPPDGDMKLQLLHNTLWMNLKEGDIVLWDEFLRGFPEVYNGLIDIMTSREVAGYRLPKVFFIAASNSVAAYDQALSDRLLHILVPDIRRSASAKLEAKRAIVDGIGLHKTMVTASEMDDLIDHVVAPMYNMLDSFKGRGTQIGAGKASTEGLSVRNLIGQALLREVQTDELKELIEYNNTYALQQNKAQYVVLMSGKNPDPKYLRQAASLKKDVSGKGMLTDLQERNLRLNLQLVEMENAIAESTPTEKQEELPDDDLF